MSEAYKAYLAGPMSGIPQFNFPAFFAAADHLREQGWEIISPAEIDNEEDKGNALRSPDGKTHINEDGTEGRSEKSWGDFLARDVKLVSDEVQAIILLPNWFKSKGALLESFVGLLCGRDFYLYDQMEGAVRMSSASIAAQVSVAIADRVKG